MGDQKNEEFKKFKRKMKKEHEVNISRDKSDPDKYWITFKGCGKGTLDDPHIHDTVCVDKKGNIVDGHTTVVVDGKKMHLNWHLDDSDD